MYIKLKDNLEKNYNSKPSFNKTKKKCLGELEANGVPQIIFYLG